MNPKFKNLQKVNIFLSLSLYREMKQVWSFMFLSWLCLGFFGKGHSGNLPVKPRVVKIGSIFSFDSVVGKVAKIAIEEAVKDVNSNPNILPQTQLQISMQNSNCSGFMGMVEGIT